MQKKEYITWYSMKNNIEWLFFTFTALLTAFNPFGGTSIHQTKNKRF